MDTSILVVLNINNEKDRNYIPSFRETKYPQ